jgi:hypothetical protein
LDIFFKGGVITVAKQFKVGDTPPSGYLDQEEWWYVQKKGGLIQEQCSCGRYCFAQELSGKVRTYKAKNKKGITIEVTMPICIECDGKHGSA